MTSARLAAPARPLGLGRRVSEALFLVGMLVMAAGIGAAAGAAPFLALAGGAALLVGTRMLANPELATLLVVGVVYSNIAVVGVRMHGAPAAIQFVIPLLLAIPLADRALRGRQAPVAGAALPFAAIFLGAQALSTVFARDPAVALEGLRVSALEGVALYALLTNAVTSVVTLRRALWLIVAIAGILGALSVVQTVTGSYDQTFLGFAQPGEEPPPVDETDPFPEEPRRRLGGPIGEKNRYGQVLLLAAPLGALFALQRTSRARAVAAAMTVLCAGGILLTFSRGAALAVMALIACLFVLKEVTARQLGVVVAIAVLALVAIPDYRNRLTSITALSTATDRTVNPDEGDTSIRSRVTENLAALQVFADHPVLGVGPGLFPTYYQEYAKRVGIRVKNEEREAHNLYLGIAAEVGAIGLIAFLGLNFVALRDLLRARRRAVDPALRTAATGLFLSLTGYLVSGLFLHLSFVRYFWLVLGLAGAAGAIARAEPAVSHERGVAA